MGTAAAAVGTAAIFALGVVVIDPLFVMRGPNCICMGAEGQRTFPSAIAVTYIRPPCPTLISSIVHCIFFSRVIVSSDQPADAASRQPGSGQ